MRTHAYYNNWVRVSDGETTGWIFGAYIEKYSSYDMASVKRELDKRGSIFRSYQDYEVMDFLLQYLQYTQ